MNIYLISSNYVQKLIKVYVLSLSLNVEINYLQLCGLNEQIINNYMKAFRDS